MNLMILLIILSISLVFSIWLWNRNNQVALFYGYIVELAYSYNVRQLNKHNLEYKDAFQWFAEKYIYEDFLFSFKSLELEYWYTKEEIEEIRK